MNEWHYRVLNQQWRAVLKRHREPASIYVMLATEVIGIAVASAVLIDKLR